MSTIPCTTELCAADRHESTTGPVRHHRVITNEGEPHRVVALWADEDATTAVVEMTYDETTVTIKPHEAAFWARVLTAGGSWSSAAGPNPAAMATDLGTAAEVLFYLAPDGPAPEFGSYHLGRSVSDLVSGYFEDEDDEDADELNTAGCAR